MELNTIKKYKILNLYANIGGNRKLWGEDYDITAIELDPKIAQIYQDFWPHDKVIVADAHQYLLDHYKEFDFIWSSPPCPTHSKLGKLRTFNKEGTGQYSPAKYPDMALYQEILLLQGYFKGKWCVENVIAWYDPLIPPNEMSGHWLWTNFQLSDFNTGSPRNITGNKNGTDAEVRAEKVGFDLSKYTGINKTLALRDCTEPELGLHILKEALKETPKLF